MWCPKCKSEYISGIDECPECKVQLVDKLPEQSIGSTQNIEYVELLRTESLPEIAFIKSLLDSAGLTYYFKGEHFSQSRFGMHPAQLMVSKEHADQARELLREFTRDR